MVGIAASFPQEERSSDGASFLTTTAGAGETGNWIGLSPRERERENYETLLIIYKKKDDEHAFAERGGSSSGNLTAGDDEVLRMV